jgi:serine/threonine protein kinase
VEGELLSAFLRRQRGGRLDPFEAMHLLHALADGIELIHDRGEYHGDLHEDNVLVQRRGLGFDVKLVDMFRWGKPSAANIHEDVIDLVKLFHLAVGGPRRYAQQPQEVKEICRGLRRSLILERFRTAGQLRQYLESLDWSSR